MATIKLRQIHGYVKVVVSHGQHRWKLSTRIKVPEKYWSKDHLLHSCPNFKMLNDSIHSVFNQVIQASINVRNRSEIPTVHAVRVEYESMQSFSATEPDPEQSKADEFGRTYSKFIAYKTPQIRKSTTRLMYHVKSSMEEFMEFDNYNFTPHSFDNVVFSRFTQFLLLHIKSKRYREKYGLLDSTINLRVRWLKRFLQWAYPERSWKHINYRSPKQEDIIVIREYELKELIEYKTVGEMELAKDLFVFMCLTGMRFSDTQLFQPEWISNGIIDYRMQKTGGRATPPLFRTTENILVRHRGYPPKISNPMFNRRIKELFLKMKLTRKVKITSTKGHQVEQKFVPLHAAVSAHVARKSFITIALSKGIPVQDVMKMSGHSDFKSMKPYIEISKEHIIEVSKKWNI